MVADFPECRGNGREVGVAEAEGPAIRVGQVNVPELGAGEAECGGEVGFLQIHVKQVAEQLHVLGL